ASSYELGLLELQRFLIKDEPSPRQHAATYAILDPSTQEQAGIARAQFGPLARLLRGFVRRTFLPTRLEVYETEDESLVFTVRRMVGWWGQRVEIYDADDQAMGFGEQRLLSGGSGFCFYDRRGLPFAKLDGEFRELQFRFVSRDGRELGVVTRGD